MVSQWTRNQIIAVLAIIVPAVIAIITLFIQVQGLEQKIQPVIEMKPQIINVNNNITRVEKEIANLQEMLKQEDALKEVETFTKKDLNVRFKKIYLPEKIKGETEGVLLFELKKIPFKNSVNITSQNLEFISQGAIPSSAITINRNIVGIYCRNILQLVLTGDTDVLDITYLPDNKTEEPLWQVQGASCASANSGITCKYSLKANNL